MKTLILALGIPLLAMAVAIGLSIAFGGPGTPTPMETINNPFRDVDYSDLPPLARYAARDGENLAFRAYPPAPGPAKGSIRSIPML